METSARLTAKGQITIPKSVREALSLQTGDRVLFQVRGEQAVIARTPDLLELAGTFEVPAEVRGLSWTEITARTWQDVADDLES